MNAALRARVLSGFTALTGVPRVPLGHVAMRPSPLLTWNPEMAIALSETLFGPMSEWRKAVYRGLSDEESRARLLAPRSLRRGMLGAFPEGPDDFEEAYRLLRGLSLPLGASKWPKAWMTAEERKLYEEAYVFPETAPVKRRKSLWCWIGIHTYPDQEMSWMDTCIHCGKRVVR